MKKLTLLLAVLVLTGQALLASSAPKPKTVHVTTADEFLEAIASNCIIVLDADYYDLTAAIQERPDLFMSDDRPISYVDQFDGPELHVNDVQNLTIQVGATEGGVSTILIDPRYAFVIYFESCKGITLDGVTFGHTEEGYCDRGVLGFEACENVHIKNCDLFGCGTEGIDVSGCDGFLFENSKIRDCSYYIMHVSNCSNVHFVSSQFFRNREFEQVSISGSDDVSFVNCMFANNEGPLFNVSSPVALNNCVILHLADELGGNVELLEAINCIFEYPFPEVG